jgi:pimeloyl-ACP methyl ester carboxylesterase
MDAVQQAGHTADALLLHGAGAGGWEWNIWGRVLAAHGIRAATPDLQPVATGLQHTLLDDYLDQARQARELCDPGGTILIGASLGGWIAQALAAEHPPLALVLINPLPPRPEAMQLPERSFPPEHIPWRRNASLAGTRRAVPDADEAACVYAFERWRDESSAALAEAWRSRPLPAPKCPALIIVSADDEDVPPAVSLALARRTGADVMQVPGSHAGPLLGRQAAEHAGRAVEWIRRACPPLALLDGQP